MDKKLRQFLLASCVSVILALGGCAGNQLYGRLTALESDNTKNKVDNAALNQKVDDFRQSFEDFKKDVQDDIKRHHYEK